MLRTGIRFRRLGIVTIISLLAQLALIACLIWAIILSTNSDEHFPELLRKLRPAGNCLCESSTVFDCKWSQSLRPSNNALVTGATDTTEEAWQFKHGRDDDDLGMSEDRCNAAFPGLFEEVHRAVRWRIEQGRNITRADLDAVTIERGRIRAMIIDGKIRVLEASHSFDDHRKRALATLYSIHRAISADPKAIPNIEFIISLDDMVDTPSQSVWALTRRSQDHNLWIVPDFGFWSWDLDDIGTIDDVAEQIIRDEGATGWDAKIPKLVWRGTTKMLPKLRGALLDASRGKTWGDVAALTPGSPPKNYLGAADQCRYMFLAHAEGRSYSGSLKYRQLCRSVIVIHKLQWIQHYHYLLVANGTEQNYVEVERDFSDLTAKMEYLVSHPEEAKRIADNNVKTFRERYFSPAAGACYWRALIHGWAASSFQPETFESTPEGDVRPRGMRFENFAVINTADQMEFKWNKSRK
ncbi:hypothetical protein OIDMADRAFT_167594 [Oidiodendron maius Zn]|uniref:Glycosyl transferase CAP10 domain-containing protein n=1 Tax=Oidiodendron maius (strain Zn) TaxID=913774 RepID=A0A0C3D6V7_OIDMZ|nr:hypothetical protein OIDMADRAFT_167594 [Oidiodendron maius Zn]